MNKKTVKIFHTVRTEMVKKCFLFWQAEITKCVVKKELTSEQPWLSSVMESVKYALTTIYVYVMKEPWTAGQ